MIAAVSISDNEALLAVFEAAFADENTMPPPASTRANVTDLAKRGKLSAMHFLLLIDLKFYTIMYTMVDALTAQ